MSIVTSHMKFMADTGFIEGRNVEPTIITFYRWHFSIIIIIKTHDITNNTILPPNYSWYTFVFVILCIYDS